MSPPPPPESVEVCKSHDVPLEIRRMDYKESQFFLRHTELELQLDYENTKVKTVLRVCRNMKIAAGHSDFLLYGADTISIESICLKLDSAASEGLMLNHGEHYKISSVDSTLTIKGSLLPDKPDELFTIIITSYVNPSTNTELSGLYRSGPLLCTQMEAEGFRRLTYSLDRPDVASTYKVRLEADKSKFPILLCNGNQIESGDLPGGKHFVVFDDPFPKPSYLFGIVAGNLVSKEDSFMRSNGKPVRLSLWCEPKDLEKLGWALECLKKAMKWDEDKFGRVYDLDWFNIVAVSYFNMGAMENKSLNIFNSARLLAHKETSTDEECIGVLSCVAHEYFHNWTGNRVSCRDWFQLTLKEGLTVYRHQEFTRDVRNSSVERIKNVLEVRSLQFPEDSGPLAHCIRPESYQRIDNFYTKTIYCKGAEVCRMYEKILGREGFRKGMDLYFKRHDGKSVTCDDFRAAMSDANNVDLTQFERWYSQAGTPTVTVESMQYNQTDKTFTISLKQSCSVQSKNKLLSNKPFHIPVAVGLIGRKSHNELMSSTVQFTEEKQTFTFKNINEEPVLSVFRDFCAPVKVDIPSMTDSDYGILMSHDTDGFNRWEACQKLMTKVVLERAAKLRDSPKDTVAVTLTSTLELIIEGFKKMIVEGNSAISAGKGSMSNLHFISYVMLVPTVSTLMSDFIPCNPMALHFARTDIMKFIAVRLEKEFISMYDSLTKLVSSRDWDLSVESVAIRSLRNRLLSYLTINGQIERASHHYKSSNNMNDRVAALSLLVDFPKEEITKAAIADLLNIAKGDDLVINKWFSIQANAHHECILACVKELKKHKLFNLENPNRARSLLVAFTMNPYFHSIDGQGYKFFADCIIEFDKINPNVAAVVAKGLAVWKTMDSERQVLMKSELMRLSCMELSANCKEILMKSLQSE